MTTAEVHPQVELTLDQKFDILNMKLQLATWYIAELQIAVARLTAAKIVEETTPQILDQFNQRITAQLLHTGLVNTPG
jgi:hypothetical protein